MKVTVIPAEQNLIETIASCLLPEGGDFSRNWVIFPEKRPAHYLRRCLGEKIRQGFIPPRIDSFDDFVDRIYSEKIAPQDRKLEALDAVGLLYQLHRSNPSPMGGQAFLNFDQFFPLGLKLYHDLEELKNAMITRENLLQVDSLAPLTLPEETAARLQELSFFYKNFYNLLLREKASSPAFRLAKIIEHFSPEIFQGYTKIILAGFFSLTRSEAQLIQKMLSLDNVYLFLIAGKGLEEIIKNLNLSAGEIENADTGTGNDEISAELKFYMAPDTHGQIFILNQEMADKIGEPSRLSEKQVIVLPAAETLFPLYQQTLASLPPEAFNISLGYPLRRTPLYSFFDSLFNLIQTADEEKRFYAPDYLNFVLHPYTKNIYFRGQPRKTEFTRILFHLLEETLSGRKGKLFWSQEELENDPEVLRRLSEYTMNNPEAPEPERFREHLSQIHRMTIAPFLTIENLRDFAAKLINLIEYLATNSTASLHLFFQPYAEAFLRQFEKLQRSLVGHLRFENLFSYFNLFRKIMASASVPFPGTPLRGLQVLGFWETRCLQFDEVYLLDMNEEVIPPAGKADSLLPYPLRKALGLPTYEELERRMEYYLNILIRGAKKACFLFIENSEKEKSRFVEKILWEKQKKDRRPDASSYINSIRYQVALLSPEVKPIPKSEKILAYLREFRYSASALDAYLSCPLKFYYGYVLKLEEREELAESLEKKDIGSLVHLILQQYFQKWVGKVLRPEILKEEELRGLIARNFGHFFGERLSGSFFLIKQQVERHLVDFLHYYQIPLVKRFLDQGKPFQLLAVEQTLETLIEVEGISFRLGARIDRAEKRGDQLFLLDYKTTASEKPFEIKFSRLDLSSRLTWPEAIGSLQLPLYNLICSAIYHQKPEEIFALLLLLGKNRLDEAIEYSPFSEDSEERGEELALVMEVIKGLLREIQNPDIPFTRELAREGSCSYCLFLPFCGQ